MRLIAGALTLCVAACAGGGGGTTTQSGARGPNFESVPISANPPPAPMRANKVADTYV